MMTAAVLLSATATAFADTTLTTSNQFGDTGSTDKVYIADGMVRVDNNQGGYMLFDSDERTMTMVEPSNQSYMVMTEESLRSMGDAVQQAMQQLEDQMANMPPEQRERMRSMMKERMGGMMNGAGKTSKPEIIKTGETRTVAGYECRVVRIMMDGASTGSACMSDFDTLGIPAEDKATIEAMMEFSLALTEQFGEMMPAHMKAMAAEGYPVEFESQAGGTRIQGSLKAVKTEQLAGELFSVPDNYRQRSMPNMPGG
jgi:hypothetical protein